MEKKKTEIITTDILLADLLLRISALEKLLMNKGFILEDEFKSEMNKIANEVAKNVLQKANIQGDLDKTIQDLRKKEIKN